MFFFSGSYFGFYAPQALAAQQLTAAGKDDAWLQPRPVTHVLCSGITAAGGLPAAYASPPAAATTPTGAAQPQAAETRTQ